MKHLKKRRLRWALIGASLSFLGALGEWMVLKLFSEATTDSLLLTYFYTELDHSDKFWIIWIPTGFKC